MALDCRIESRALNLQRGKGLAKCSCTGSPRPVAGPHQPVAPSRRASNVSRS